MTGSSERASPAGVVVLTDRRLALRPLPDLVRAAVDGGVRWVLLRERDLPRGERVGLAEVLREILARAGGTLLVAGPDPLDGQAVHLPAAGPYPPPRLALVGRSCHDQAELARLSTEDYATLSPVFSTATKPGYGPPLLPTGLARLIGRAVVPVLALGGVTRPEHAAACRAAGAAGVAVLGAVMRARDPAAVVAALAAGFAAGLPAEPSVGASATGVATAGSAAAGRAATSPVATGSVGTVPAAMGSAATVPAATGSARVGTGVPVIPAVARGRS